MGKVTLIHIEMFVAFRSTLHQVSWYICLLLLLSSPDSHSIGKDVDTHTEFEKVTHNKNAVRIIIIIIIINIYHFYVRYVQLHISNKPRF